MKNKQADKSPQNRLRGIASRLKNDKPKSPDLNDVYQEYPYANVDKFLLDFRDAFESGNQQKIWDSYKNLTSSIHYLGKAVGIK